MIKSVFIFLESIPVMFPAILKSLRINQYWKNGLVFLPLVLVGQFDALSLYLIATVFLLFSLLASGAYVINEVFDRPKDVLHPQKRHRPIVSGKVSTYLAFVVAAVLTLSSLLGALFLSLKLFLIFTTYVLLQIVYSAKVRDVVVLDGVFIAGGFVLRLWAGATPLNISISYELAIAIFFSALFVVFLKRLHELLTLTPSALTYRQSLLKYKLIPLDLLIYSSGAGALVAYLIFISGTSQHYGYSGNEYLFYLAPLISLGMIRLAYLAYKKNLATDPVELFLRDRFLLPISITGVIFLLYGYFGA